jgi:hypothetical protein
MYSDWFHYAQHPVRNGVYQIQVGKVDYESQWFRKFKDGFWYSGAETPAEAAKEKHKTKKQTQQTATKQQKQNKESNTHK